MADELGNVLVLPSRGQASDEQPVPAEVLRATIERLADQGDCLRQVSPDVSWSAQQWMIASTPFRMRLTSARRRLSELSKLGSSGEQTNIRWAFEFNDARLRAERLLHDIEMCLQTLQRINISAADRARENEMFASTRSDLLKALGKTLDLLRQRFSVFPDVNSWQSHDRLRTLNEELGVMVDACRDEPSDIDSYVLDYAGHTVNVAATIYQIYRIMKAGVFAEDCQMRQDGELWEAFREQQNEFLGFYRSALAAIEIYQEVLQAYTLIKDNSKLRPGYGDLESIRQDKRAHVMERADCIEAVSNFHGKFSAMLSILPSADSG